MGWFTDLLFGTQAEVEAPAQRDTAPVRPTLIGFPDGGGLITSVTAESSLGLSSVWRALDILSNGVSQLPWREFRGNEELVPSRLVRRPQADRTRREWTSLVVSTLALYDVCFLLKVGGTDSEGIPMGLLPLPPEVVRPVPNPYNLLLPAEEYFIGDKRVSRDELIVLRRGPQPLVEDGAGGVLRLARVSFASALSAERYASRFWQSGGAPLITLESDARLTTTEAQEIADRWAERRAKGPDYPVVLGNGMHAHEFGMDPTTASAVEARRELVADIGRYFGIPTAMLNAPSADGETYRNTQEANLDLVRFTLSNYRLAIEDAITDVLPGDRRMVMDTNPLTRGTQLDRAQAWQLALTGDRPWLTVDEVRQAEGLPPMGE